METFLGFGICRDLVHGKEDKILTVLITIRPLSSVVVALTDKRGNLFLTAPRPHSPVPRNYTRQSNITVVKTYGLNHRKGNSFLADKSWCAYAFYKTRQK